MELNMEQAKLTSMKESKVTTLYNLPFFKFHNIIIAYSVLSKSTCIFAQTCGPVHTQTHKHTHTCTRTHTLAHAHTHTEKDNTGCTSYTPKTGNVYNLYSLIVQKGKRYFLKKHVVSKSVTPINRECLV